MRSRELCLAFLMKRAGSCRSFAVIAVVAFAMLELVFAQPALAGTKCCKPGTSTCTCVSTVTCPSTYPSLVGTCPLPYTTGTSSGSSSGTINSTINCVAPSGTNNVDLTAVSQSLIQTCVVETNGVLSPAATCQLDISYSGLTAAGGTSCQVNPDNQTSTLTAAAFCGNGSPGLVVAGTLNCNPQGKTGSELPPICNGNTACTMNLDGITSVPNGKCSDVFPVDGSLVAGQVLQATVVTDDTSCTGQLLSHGDIRTRYCNSGKFDPAVASKCLFPSQQVSKISATTSVFIPVQVDVSPQTINTDCTGGAPMKKDQGNVKFTIFGSEVLDVTKINQASLAVEGTNDGLTCGSPTTVNKDGFPDLTCAMSSCPNLGPALSAHSNNGTVNVSVTGSLLSGTAIFGEDTVKTSP